MSSGSDREPTQPTQVLLRLHYQHLRANRAALPDFADVEFKCYSQNGEDGILLYLFSMIGTTSQKVVEICAGNCIECNAANLIVNHNWRGLLVDGNPDLIATGKAFYASHPHTLISPPRLVSSWIDTDSVNGLIASNGFAGEIDLLSLDLDGMDYWIWRAIDCINPRVVVLEFNGVLGPDKRVTIPYDPAFRADLTLPGPPKWGASLAAFAALGRAKGYRLIGVQSMGFNAFFMRDDLGQDIFPERTPLHCYEHTPRLTEFNAGWLDLVFAGGQRWDEV